MPIAITGSQNSSQVSLATATEPIEESKVVPLADGIVKTASDSSNTDSLSLLTIQVTFRGNLLPLSRHEMMMKKRPTLVKKKDKTGTSDLLEVGTDEITRFNSVNLG